MTVSLITGASSGMGRSLALRLARRGEAIVAVARRKDLLDTLVDEITQAGGRAIAIACDVTDRAGVQAAVAEAQARFGPLDRLIACAGGGERTQVEGFSAEHVDRVMAMNLGGTVHCIEAVLPDMLARGGGHIVAVSSLASSRGLPGAAAYGAAKAALSNLMESLRMELGARGIAVTLICPGFVRTKPPGKKKPKRFRVDLEKATAVMCSAIVNRVRYCAFPRGLTLVVRMASLLPAALYDRLLMIAGSRRK